MDIDKFISNIKALDPLDILLESAALGSEELAEANRSNLSKGELSTGEQTEEYASLPYTNYKSSIGSQSVPNMDFKLKGGFHKGIFSKVVGSDVQFGSTDSKSEMLQQKGGDEIFTVQQQQFSDVIKKYASTIINKKLSK